MSILNKDSRAASDRARTEEVRAEFEDALAKIDTIEEGAEVNQTDAEIKTQYEANADTNAFTDAEQTTVGILAAVPTTDPGDGVTVWNDAGVLKVTPI